jgi:hypothetical protein
MFSFSAAMRAAIQESEDRIQESQEKITPGMLPDSDSRF